MAGRALHGRIGGETRPGAVAGTAAAPFPAAVLLILVSLAAPAGAPELSASAIETLLNETAAELDATLGEQGRGYSYYTYGTNELLYAVGDLDGDGVPEIAARGVYFLGVGSYDLVDIFARRAGGYERVAFINLYHLGLQDRVTSLAVHDGLLRLATVGVERGREIEKKATVRWRLDEGAAVVPGGDGEAASCQRKPAAAHDSG